MASWWRADEGEGTSVSDAVGTNTGTFVGGTTWSTSGRFGNALTFNGTTGRINITGAVLNAYPVTMCGWFFTAVTAGVQPIFTIQSSNNTNMFRLILYQSKLQGQHGENASSVLVASAANYPLSAWNHGCVVFVSDTSRFIYLNGVLDGTSTGTELLPTGLQDTYIGGTVSVNEWMNGSLDEIKVFNHTLNADEIIRQYVRGRMAR